MIIHLVKTILEEDIKKNFKFPAKSMFAEFETWLDSYLIFSFLNGVEVVLEFIVMQFFRFGLITLQLSAHQVDVMINLDHHRVVPDDGFIVYHAVGGVEDQRIGRVEN